LILNVNNNYYAFGNFFSPTAPFYGVSPLGSKEKNIFPWKIFGTPGGRKSEDAAPRNWPEIVCHPPSWGILPLS
jgi:hypothetical protein